MHGAQVKAQCDRLKSLDCLVHPWHHVLQESARSNSLPEGQVVEDIVDLLRSRHALPNTEGGSIVGYSRDNPFFMSGPLPQRGERCLDRCTTGLCLLPLQLMCSAGMSCSNRVASCRVLMVMLR